MELFFQSQLFAVYILVLIIGFILSMLKKGWAQKAITVLLVSAALTLVLFISFVYLHIGIVIILVISTLLYAFLKKELIPLERWVIGLLGPLYHAKYLGIWFFSVPALPFEIGRLMAVFLFVYLLAKKRFKIPDETGFLFIWSMFILLDITGTLFHLKLP